MGKRSILLLVSFLVLGCHVDQAQHPEGLAANHPSIVLTGWQSDVPAQSVTTHEVPWGRQKFFLLFGLVLSSGLLVWGAIGLGKIWRFVMSCQSPRLRKCLPFTPSWICLIRKKKLLGVLDALGKHISELEEAEQEMGKWVSEIVHDLNAPLGAIQGYAELMNGNCFPHEPCEAQRYASAILDLGERLQGLVGDLLQISLIKAGRHAPQMELISMAELVADTAQLYRNQFLSNGFFLQLTFFEDLCLMQGNPRLLQRMVQNLLENALRYSKTGSVVEVRMNPTPTGFELEIENQGEALGQGNLAHLFNRFEREMEPGRQGAGLGLTIVREIVTIHQAEIMGFRDEKGRTTFRIGFKK